MSQKGRISEAIDWHIKAVALHERLLRKAPAVVRHRSDLAISLNNLGVAYCRLERADDADAAFARARELLTTLADDYPQEPAYRSSLAALLNNQALALAGAGRHEEAIRSYATAIESQRDRYEQQPDSAMMREVLSKMYYNYGQSLLAAGKPAEAAKAALARRDLWKDNGERLFGVAVELAQISGELHGGSGSSRARLELDNEVVATLRMALENGSPGKIDLATDDRFAHLRGNTEFAALLAEVKISDTASSDAVK